MSVIQESDGGTKRACYNALGRVQRELAVAYGKAIEEYWNAVLQRAKQLCLEYGAYDTGTLYRSIRLVWETHPQFGLYEVAFSSRGASVTGYIRAGGGAWINPKTGKLVDYAQAVHDGTKHMAPRPFIQDAVDQMESVREQIMKRHIDNALSKFERVM